MSIVILITASTILAQTKEKEVEGMLENIKWLGHASVLIKGPKIIYIDPWKIKDTSLKADLILITHEHYDHCSALDLAKIQKPETVILAPPACRKELGEQITKVKPNMKSQVAGVDIETVPAYNLDKPFHPKSNNGVGYIVTINGVRIYHAGDSDFVPEMNNIKADIVFVPVGGTYTMNATEAAKMVNVIKPHIAIPIHFGSTAGSLSDAQDFKAQAEVEVRILPESK